MKEYIETVAYTAIFSAFVQMLVPDKFKREAAFILGMIMLLTVCAPLEKLISGIHIPKLSAVAAKADDHSALRENLMSSGMAAELEKRLAAQTGADDVKAELSQNGDIISLTLYGDISEAQRRKAAELCGADISAVHIINRR